MTRPNRASFQWQDPLLLDAQLTDDERAVRDAARAYCQDKLMPRVTDALPEPDHRCGDLPRNG